MSTNGKQKYLENNDTAIVRKHKLESFLHFGDAQKLSTMIEDNSVDLIFTDPPYLKKYIPIYGWLAKEAARVLKPTGFLIVYVGTYWKDDTMALMRQNLEYFWNFVIENNGSSPMHWQRKVLSRHKDLIAYRPKNGIGMPVCNVLSLWRGGGRDKRFHAWGQDLSSARYYIDVFSRPEDLVVDYFLGGGTTGVVAKKLKRNFIGFEIDEESFNVAKTRIEATGTPKEYEQTQLKFDCNF